tara:strand:+ start:79 stop:1113 length:1035 start_codon:yes stop_codon:yes gene_type:complete
MKYLLITIVSLVFVGCSEQNQSVPAPLEKFWFQYNGQQEAGFRYWERDGDGIWTETYPSGHQSMFREEGRDSVDGLVGVYAVKLKGDIEKTGTQDRNFRVFIPDYQKKNSFIYLSYKTAGDWTNWRKTNYSINALTTRDGRNYEDMPKEIKLVIKELEADFISMFYVENNIEEKYRISFEDLVKISKEEDDRSNISEGLKFFKIEDYYKATRTSLYFTPDNAPVPGPPPFTIRHKYVLGEYLVEEVDFPMPDGGIKKIKMVIVQLGDSTRFLVHAFDEKILRLALLTKTSENELRCKEVGLNDNGEKISFIGNVVIGKGFLNGEFEVFQNGMLIGKEKSTYEYE